MRLTTLALIVVAPLLFCFGSAQAEKCETLRLDLSTGQKKSRWLGNYVAYQGVTAKVFDNNGKFISEVAFCNKSEAIEIPNNLEGVIQIAGNIGYVHGSVWRERDCKLVDIILPFKSDMVGKIVVGQAEPPYGRRQIRTAICPTINGLISPLDIVDSIQPEFKIIDQGSSLILAPSLIGTNGTYLGVGPVSGSGHTSVSGIDYSDVPYIELKLVARTSR